MRLAYRIQKINQLTVAGLFVMALLASNLLLMSTAFAAPGDPGDPIIIEDCDDLQAIGELENLDKHFKIGENDISCEETNSWNEDAGFIPIGTWGDPFRGSLDGNGKKITGLFIDRDDTDRVGLFGTINNDGYVSNLTLEDMNITGRDWVGGFAGYNDPDSEFENITVSGVVEGGHCVGGAIGYHRGLADNFAVAGEVYGDHEVGGMVGCHVGTEDTIIDSQSSARVEGSSVVGGLVGANFHHDNEDPDIVGSSASGNVYGEEFVGGLVGLNHAGAIIEDSYASGDVHSFANSNYIGGFVGHSNGPIISSGAAGDIIIEDSGNGEGDGKIGGFVGQIQNNSSVTASYATGSVSITAGGYSRIGGFVGSIDHGTVEQSLAKGNVNAPEGTTVGGFVGDVWGYEDNAFIRDSYALGNVTGNDGVGGFAGSFSHDTGSDGLYRVYATGEVTANADEPTVGGLVANSNVTVADSFWDSQTTGQVSSDGGTGKTTAQMTNLATYTDEDTPGLDSAWDFIDNPNDDEADEDIWAISENNNGYPCLSWEEATCSLPADIDFEDLKVLLVKNDEGISHSYLDNYDIDYDVIEPSDFAAATVEYFLGYNVVIYESGDNPLYDDLRAGLPNLSAAMEQQGIVVSIRVAGNMDSQDNIDFYSTDFIQEYGSEVEFADSESKFLTGQGTGGKELNESDFADWDDTFHGWLDNTPTSQPSYNEILTSEFGPLWIEYQHELGFVMVDTLTSVEGGWGDGNADVADNYIRYIAWLAGQHTEPITESGSDYNGDGIDDSEQPYVSSYISSITGKRVVIDVGEDCELQVDDLVRESNLPVQDPAYDYANGLFDFEAECAESTTTVKLFYYNVAMKDLVARKFNPTTNAYFNLAEFGATIEETTINGSLVTVVSYQITDGGSLDVDGEVNGIIVDPVGLAANIVGVPSTGLESY